MNFEIKLDETERRNLIKVANCEKSGLHTPIEGNFKDKNLWKVYMRNIKNQYFSKSIVAFVSKKNETQNYLCR